jgi:hypothetical protein
LNFYQAYVDFIIRKYLGDVDAAFKRLGSQLDFIKVKQQSNIINAQNLTEAQKVTAELATRASESTGQMATQASIKEFDGALADAANDLAAKTKSAELSIEAQIAYAKAVIEQTSNQVTNWHNRTSLNFQAAQEAVRTMSARISGASGMINAVDVQNTSSTT